MSVDVARSETAPVASGLAEGVRGHVSGNGSCPSGAVVPAAPFALVHDDPESEAVAESFAGQRRSWAVRLRKWLKGALLLVLLFAVLLGLLWWMFGWGRQRARVEVGGRARADAEAGAGVTRDAIAEVTEAVAAAERNAGSAKRGTTVLDTGAKDALRTPRNAAVVSRDYSVLDPAPAMSERAVIDKGGAAGETPRSERAGAAKSAQRSSPSSERSIAFLASVRGQVVAAAKAVVAGDSSATVESKKVAVAVVTPPFGTLVPVKTLGVIYTLRGGNYARFEVARDVSGEGWQLARGTVFVGTLRGADYDRAYINALGFIDPRSGRLVRLAGELLGQDGASGLKGKRHKVSSLWSRVFGRLGGAALGAGGAVVLRRPVIIGGLENVYGELPGGRVGLSGRSSEFVEVPAGTPGYFLVSELPPTARGVVAAPPEAGAADELSDAELAALIESGDPEALRAALPRLSPELRRVAEAALAGGP